MKIPVYAKQNCDAQLYTLCTKHCIHSHKMNILIFGNRTQEKRVAKTGEKFMVKIHW